MLTDDDLLAGTLDVVGSTVFPAAPHLPFYLPQILRSADGRIYLEHHDNSSRRFFHHGLELDSLEPYLTLATPIPARPRHRLMQFRDGEPPRYLGDREAAHELEESGLHSIELALQTLSRADTESARAHALYAYNALPTYYARPRLLLYCLVALSSQRDKLERELADLPRRETDEQRRHLRLQIEQHVTDLQQRVSLLDHPLLRIPQHQESPVREDPKRAFIRSGRQAQADASAA
jgi:hypothetical protein